MNKNNSIQKPDLSEAVNSAIELYFNYTSTSSTNLTKFFGEELYRITVPGQHFVAPNITVENNAKLTKMSKRISRQLSFASKIYSDVIRTLKNKFTDEQLRCIVHAIISYQTYEWKVFHNIRRYMYVFIRNHGDEMYYLGDLKSYKSKICRISLFEFEILMDLIFLLREDNKPEYIFKLVKTM